jgi:hypothetical protein
VQGGNRIVDEQAGLWTAEGLLEAYVFEAVAEPSRIADTKSQLAGAPGVAFVAQFVGHFSLFARVTAESLGQLQERIDGDYREAGIRSDWSLNLTASKAAAPKRASPDICALVCARTTSDPFEIQDALDGMFLLPGEGAAVINHSDFDLLVDLGAETIDDLVKRVKLLRQQEGIGRTATAFADLANNAIRPGKS